MFKKERFIKTRKAVGAILSFALTAGPFSALANPVVYAQDNYGVIQEITLTEEQQRALDEVQYVQRYFSGLIGFEYDYALPEDDSLVSIFVVLNSSPAEVQVIEYEAFDGYIGAPTLEEAEAIVEEEQASFYEDLNELFEAAPSTFAGFEIDWVFQRAINGFVLTVPADRVEEIAQLDDVAFVVPNELVTIPEPVEVYAGEADRDPLGMRDARITMNADSLHAMGYRGEGVLIAVLDTGIDYFHPAFAGTFPTLEYMYRRNPDNPYLGYWAGFTGSPQSGQNPVPAVIPGHNYFYGRNFIKDNGWAPWNDPMETTPFHRQGAPGTPGHNLYVAPGAASSHGTHVAGTIAGQDTGHENSILGIAPGAKMIHYRVLGPGGSQFSSTIAGIEMAHYDLPDIVNMSLGGAVGAGPFIVTSLSVNNTILANPNMVFTISVGNSGDGFGTIGHPGAASLAIGVSSLTIPGDVGMIADFGFESFERTVGGRSHEVNSVTPFSFIHQTYGERFVWAEGEDFITNTSGRLGHGENGEMRIIALPRAAGSPGNVNAATGNQFVHVGMGSERPDWELLTELYTPEELEGAWILVARGGSNAASARHAYEFGVAGVISITGQGALGTGGNQQPIFGNSGAFPYYGTRAQIDHLVGVHLLDLMVAEEEGAPLATSRREMLEFTLIDFYREDAPLRLSGFSSRGPVPQTFEIKPDIGAQGQGVWSAVPRWTVGQPWEPTEQGPGPSPWHGSGNEEYFRFAYEPASGTSMSAPTLAGAVALMVQYSRENRDEQWDAAEIKTRMMNNSIILEHDELGYGIFDMGAGQVDVLAAIQADTVVYVTFPKAVTVPAALLEQHGFIPSRTGSFSFGGSLNTFDELADGTRTRTLTATIENQSDEARTYEISGRFITSGRLSVDPSYAAIDFSTASVTVPAGGYADFDATLTLAADTPLGHVEGFVEVTSNGEIVAVLPFAAVSQDTNVLSDVSLARNVLSQNPYHFTGEELTLQFRPHVGVTFETFVFESTGQSVDELSSDVFDAARSGDYALIEAQSLPVVGFAGAASLPGTGVLSRAVVFTPQMLSNAAQARLAEGDYYLVINVYRQDAMIPTIATFYDQVVLPFSIDNSAPLFEELLVNGVELSGDNVVVVTNNDTQDLFISGNVFDAGLALGVERGNTVDIWVDGREVNLTDNLAVYVLVGENTPANRPVRALVDADGNFDVTFADVDTAGSAAVTVWAIDHYAPTVNWNMYISNIDWWWSIINPFPVAGGVFTGSGVTAVNTALNQYLLFTQFPNPNFQGAANAALFQQHVWGGLNKAVNSFVVEFDVQDEPVYVTPVLPYIIEAIPAAFVNQLQGNQNELVVSVEITWSDGSVETVEETFLIANNDAGYFEVGGLSIFVNTQGNTNIREIRLAQ